MNRSKRPLRFCFFLLLFSSHRSVRRLRPLYICRIPSIWNATAEHLPHCAKKTSPVKHYRTCTNREVSASTTRTHVDSITKGKYFLASLTRIRTSNKDHTNWMGKNTGQTKEGVERMNHLPSTARPTVFSLMPSSPAEPKPNKCLRSHAAY